MKIKRAELREIHLTLKERFEISTGGWDLRRILLLRMETEEGEAWSECVAAEAPNYSYETPETAWHILTDYVLPAILGVEWDDPGQVLAPVSWIRGHPMALATVEMGAWALDAAGKGISLRDRLGGRRDSVPVGVSVGLQRTDDELLRQVETRLSEGYRKIKLKIKPGRDVEMLRKVRDRFPHASLMADANSSYTLEDAPRLREMDELDLMMVEQPLAYDDLREHALLQARISTPICLDESIVSPGSARLALELGSGKIINIKPGRVGGFTSSLEIHDLCRSRGVPVWCGGMLEAGVGRAYNLALASLPGFTLPGDISESRRYWNEDIVEPEFVMEDGMMPVPSGVGIGVGIRMDRVEDLTRARWEAGAES
ncbi:MAG: o-succinylbenzoate synthase [Gemmatimonadota bacterium]